MNVNIQELTKSLKKYEDGLLTNAGKGFLKDDLLIFSKQLFEEGIQEGQQLELLTIIIEKEKPFPQLYKPLKYKEPSTNKDLEFVIYEIVSLQKRSSGDIAMEALVCEL